MSGICIYSNHLERNTELDLGTELSPNFHEIIIRQAFISVENNLWDQFYGKFQGNSSDFSVIFDIHSFPDNSGSISKTK